VWKSIVWVLAAGPVPVVAGILMLFHPPRGRWAILSIPAAIGTIALLFYPDGSYSPRYVLATVPLAFFLAAAPWFSARPRILAIALIVPLAAVPILTQPARAMARQGADVMGRIGALPSGAIVVPGHYCPHARLAASIQRRPDLTMMCTGWSWPADPARALSAAVDAGRPVALDLADQAWLAGEAPARDAVRAWAATRTGRLVAGFLVIGR
jgi:hypothetical protein